jgi:hypothetical protein
VVLCYVFTHILVSDFDYMILIYGEADVNY